MPLRRVLVYVFVLPCACGARSTLDGASSPGDAAIRPTDASVEPWVCSYPSGPCDSGAAAVCDGCASPAVLATCQQLPTALALDDASVVWINQGVVDFVGGHKVPTTYKDGALMRCAASGCQGVPSPIAVGLNEVWTQSFAIAGSASIYMRETGGGTTIFTTNDFECTTAPTGFAGFGYTFAADETTLFYTTWNGNAVNACSAVGCVSPTVLWTAPTPNIFTMGIAVDATDVYWTTSHGEIYRCGKSGCAGTPTLVTHTLAGMDAIAVDDANVYAAGAGLLSCPKSGCAQPTVLTIVDLPTSFLVTDGLNLYWPRVTTLFPAHGAVFRCAVSGCSAPELIAAADQPGGIAIDATHIYWSDTANGTISSLAK
jgi:hypothetical protein